MGKRKFKQGIVEQIKAEEQERVHQNKLKSKYKLKDEEIVIVEKSNTIKFLTKTTIDFIRLIISIVIFFLSVVGLAALIYPGARDELIQQGLNVYQELLQLLIC